MTASVAEAASAEVELSAEQVELLEKRKAIMQAEEQSSGFVVSEVGTTGHQDWHAAKVVAVRDVAAGVRCVTLETEVSREVHRISFGKFTQMPIHLSNLAIVGSRAELGFKLSFGGLWCSS